MFAEDSPPLDSATARALEQLGVLADASVKAVQALVEMLEAPGSDALALTAAIDRSSRSARLAIMLGMRLRAEGLVGAGRADAARRAALDARRAASPKQESDREVLSDRESLLDRPDRPDRPDRETPERCNDLTLDQALAAIRAGLGLQHPIDLYADEPGDLPDVATLIERITARHRPLKPRSIVPARIRVPALPP